MTVVLRLLVLAAVIALPVTVHLGSELGTLWLALALGCGAYSLGRRAEARVPRTATERVAELPGGARIRAEGYTDEQWRELVTRMGGKP